MELSDEDPISWSCLPKKCELLIGKNLCESGQSFSIRSQHKWSGQLAEGSNTPF